MTTKIKTPAAQRTPLRTLYPQVRDDDYSYFHDYNYYYGIGNLGRIGKKQATCKVCKYCPPSSSQRPLGALDRHLRTMHPMLWRPITINEEPDRQDIA